PGVHGPGNLDRVPRLLCGRTAGAVSPAGRTPAGSGADPDGARSHRQRQALDHFRLHAERRVLHPRSCRAQSKRTALKSEPAMNNDRYELPNLLRARAEARTGSAPTPLSVAGMTPVYDPCAIEARLADEATLRNDALRAIYSKMKHAGDMRYIVKPTSLSSL